MQRPNEIERSFPISKEFLDTSNSISWFFLDAAWMMGHHYLAHFLVIPTLVSGLLLLYIERRPAVFFINMAINCWIVMNSLWMFADTLKMPTLLIFAKATLVLGLVFILLAAYFSKDLKETFSHFKRFRGLKIFN